MGGQITTLNRCAERLFGYQRGELKEQKLELLIPLRLRADYILYRQHLLDNMGTKLTGDMLDLVGLRKNGTEFPLQINLATIKVDFSGEPMVQATIVDITRPLEIAQEKIDLARVALEKKGELEQSNADLEEFSYAVSHDLKAPLRAIGHLAEWIGEDLGPSASAEVRENIELLQGRVVRMQKLLEGLLEYSLLAHSGKSAEEVDVRDLVADIVVMLAPPAGFVVSFVGDPPPTIRTERVALQMVLENLISNALKHHDQAGGQILVSMKMIDGQAEIRVSDDGPGIPTEYQRRIFAIFQTLKSRDEVESTGIGLAIVKRKVETHGGRVWVESTPPARGATFIITWKEAAR